MVPLLLQIALAVGLTGWFSLAQGQRAVGEVVERLRSEINRRVHDYLTSYLETAHLVNGFAARAIELGELNDHDPVALGSNFFHQLQHFETLAFMFYGSAAGGAAGAGRRAGGTLTVDATEFDVERGLLPGKRSEWSADAGGGPGRLLEVRSGFDGRKRPWFTAAIEARGPAWSAVFPIFAGNELAIAASQPLYHPSGVLRGVVAVDLLLAGIDRFLRTLDIGETGSTFILERSGLLVASSSGERLLVHAPDGTSLERRQALNSPTPLVADTSRDLAEHFGNLQWIDREHQLTMEHEGERRFVQVTPLTDGRGIDWLIVTVIPESDFQGSLTASHRRTLWLCVLAFLVATLVGLHASRWIVRPVLRLVEAAAGQAAGDRSRRVEVGGVAELSELARAFNRMVHQHEELVHGLDARVKARTAELRQAKDNAETANRAKSRFLAHISHEIRTPLAAMLGYADLLSERDLEVEAVQDLEILRTQGKHLNRLLGDFLDLSRIEAGHLELAVQRVALADLLAQLDAMFRPLAEEKGLHLHIEPVGILPWHFDGDPSRLLQVLSNLLSNAIRSTGDGSVTLRVQRIADLFEEAIETPHTRLSFGVSDTGVGLTVEEQEGIFRAFTQLGPSDPKQRQGFGLGLAIVRRLVDRMEGDLTVESTKGAGACFTVRLLVAKCGSWAEQPPTLFPPPASATSSRPALAGHVLVAEDSAPLRRLCRLRLEGWGLHCTTVVNGREAVELVRTETFDVLLMDWQMDEMDGLEAARSLRQAGVETPILALTAAAMAGDREHCLAAGCDEVLSKPIDFGELYNLLAEFLDPAAVRDHEFEALMAEFLGRLPAQLETLRRALASASWPFFDRAIHRFVGTVGSYGLDELFRAAEKLEEAGQARDRRAAQDAFEELAAAATNAVKSSGHHDPP